MILKSLSYLSLLLMPALDLQTVFCFLPYSMPRYFFMIARHDVLGKTSCYKQPFTNVVVRCRGEEAFYIPMIRSQSFKEPVPLDCEFPKSQFLSPILPHHTHPPTHTPQLGWDGQNDRKLGIFLPPGQLCSDKTLAVQTQVRQFLLCTSLVKNRMFWCILKQFLSSSPLEAPADFSLVFTMGTQQMFGR